MFGYVGTSLALGLLILGIVGIVMGFLDKKREKIMKITETSKIGTLSTGLVEIQGIVIEQTLTKSPFTNTPCVYYNCIVEVRGSLSLKNEWKYQTSEVKNNTFVLKDDTGSIIVLPDNAEIDVEKAFEAIINKDSVIPEHVADFLNRHKIKFDGIFTDIHKSLRLSEYRIESNDSLYVLGGIFENKHGIKYVSKNKKPKIYYISNKSEKDILSHSNSISPKTTIIIGFFLTIFSGGFILLELLHTIRLFSRIP